MRMLPTNRLIVATGLIFFPGTLATAFLPELRTPVYAVMAVLAFIGALDAVLSRGMLSHVQAAFPPVVRLSMGRTGELAFSLTHGFKKNTRLRLGLSFPTGLVSDDQDRTPDRYVPLRKNRDRENVVLPATGLSQGRHVLERCYLECPSLFGLWDVRDSRAIRCEIRVYPDLMSERKTLAALFLDRGSGAHARRLLGKGREFEKLREYSPGDSYEDIHWKATAKRRSPVSKVYQVERTQDIYLMIDASRMSARNAAIVSGGGTRDEKRQASRASLFPRDSILERYISAALVLAMAADKQGDRFGVGVFADTMRGFMKARNGKAHFNACRDLLYTLAPEKVSPDFSEFFTFSATRLRKRSLIFILTSLEDPVIAENFLDHVHVLSRKHLVVVVMLKPAMAHPLFHRHGADVETVNDIHQHLSGHGVWAGLKELERSLYRQGVGFFITENPLLCPGLVSRYMDIKQRQAL